MTSSDAALPPGPDGVARPALVEWHASHVDGRFSEQRDRCRDAILSRQGLHHLAHYTDCVCDFTLDVLEDSLFHPGWLPSSLDQWRNNCQRIGCDLSAVVGEVDDTLQQVRTGALIRTLLQGARGSFYCDRVVPNQYLIGLNIASSTLPVAGGAQPWIDAAKTADIALTHLVTGLRKRLSLGPENPGGWLTWLSAKPSDENRPHRQAERARFDAGHSLPHIEGDQDNRWVDLCRAEVDHGDLHYVAYCRDGEVLFSIDQLGHDRLMSFYTQISVEARRNFYHDFCRQFPLLVGRLGRIVGPVIGSRLERVVLDVEQGALYSYRIGTAEYLVGVTIDQSQVPAADDKMARLAQRIRER